MGVKLRKWPKWTEAAMQGLVFWIGHRRALYSGHLLPEAALVAEACNLIQANLDREFILSAERTYRELVRPRRWVLPGENNARVDLVVSHGSGRKRHPLAVIEVKRGRASKGQIDKDLSRLAAMKDLAPDTRCWLLVVSESYIPRRFVSPEGKARLGRQGISGQPNAHFRVRRVCKASAAFTTRSHAHYACIVEIYRGSATPR